MRGGARPHPDPLPAGEGARSPLPLGEGQGEGRPARLRPFGLDGPLPLLLAGLMGALTSSAYNTMISVALPDIGQKFGLGLTEVQWVVLVYLLTNSSTLAISGRLCDQVGAPRIYRLGLMLFALGGVACVLAPSLPALLATRAVQALGTGMFIAAMPPILTAAFPDRQRGRVLGLHGTAVYVGLTVGPVLGGVLTELVGWRGVFGATVVMAVLAFWLAWRHVPLNPGGDRSARFDLLGSLIYVSILAPLLLALSRARQSGLASPDILGLVGLGTLAMVVFVRVERRAATPLVDLRLLSGRYFGLSALAATTIFVAIYAAAFLMPFYLVQARGVSPSLAGLLLTAQPICMVVVAPMVGVLSDRLGSAAPASLGALLVGLSLVLLSQVGPDTPYWYIVLGMAVLGAGASLGDVSNATALMGAVPASRRGMASGTVATTRYVGQSLGVALASAIFTLSVGAEVGPQSWSGFTTAFLALSSAGALSALVSAARGRAPR